MLYFYDLITNDSYCYCYMAGLPLLSIRREVCVFMADWIALFYGVVGLTLYTRYFVTRHPPAVLCSLCRG